MIEYDVKGCGCCKSAFAPTPAKIFNRPALTSIDYRIGTFGSFRRAMIDTIASKQALADWTARDETDYGIALIDMWAYLGDILTFYQERIANEAFLRTAVHRESVIRLAALLDYRPSPGAAAAAYVVFFLDKGKTLEIPIGLRLQSVPGQNEKPQKFETVEVLHADAALNAVRIHRPPTPFNPFAQNSTGGPLTQSVKVEAGAPLVVFDHRGIELKTVESLIDDGEVVTLGWTPAIHRNGLTLATTAASVWARQFAVFGSTTPAKTMVHTIAAQNTNNTNITFTERDTRFSLPNNNLIPLDRAVPDIKAGARVLVVEPGATRVATVVAAETKPYTMRTTGNVLLTNYSASVTELALDLRVIARPAAAIESGAVVAYAVADDGAVWRRDDEDHWRSLGGRNFTRVVATNNASQSFVFAGDSSGDAWMRGSSGWSTLGDRIDLLAANVAQGEPYVVGRAASQRATIRRRSNGAWGSWVDLAGPACDRIAVVTNNSGAIEVFVRRSGVHDVWTRRELAPNGNWSAWQSVGGNVDLLEAALNENGSVEIFGRGLNKALWHRRRTGNVWGAWGSLDGWIDRLTVVRSQNKLYAYARGSNGKVWARSQTAPNSNTWHAWSSLGPNDDVVDGLFAINGPNTFIHVFADGSKQLRRFHFGIWAQLGVPMFEIEDRRAVAVYELTGDFLPMAAERYPANISGGPIAVRLSQLPSIEKGRTIVLDDASKNPHTATVVSADVSGSHLIVAFTPGLTHTLSGASATLHGNVAKVTHGETKSETLGNGDAAARFQTFKVSKSPVTFVPQAGARNGVANTLEVRVDGVKWTEVDTLLDHANDERVFTTRVDDDNVMSVQFGGEPGARLSTGRSNVTAKYRVGLGAEGNVKANALTNLLDRPPGLKSARNPGPAQGGAAAETLDGIRVNAPNTVRTFNRIVSLLDFEDAAREHATVAKARATWSIEDFERVVSLVVAAEGGEMLEDDALKTIAADLDAKRDINRPMRIRTHENVPFSVHAIVQVDPAYLLENIQKSADEAMAKYFSFASRELGQVVHLSEVYATLQNLAGVIAVRITRLRRKSGGPEVGDHVLLQPYELAMLEAPTDVVITPQFVSL